MPDSIFTEYATGEREHVPMKEEPDFDNQD